MNRKPVYYAHSMRKYNTPAEAQELEILEGLAQQRGALFRRAVINPNGLIQSTNGAQAMEECFRLIDGCHSVVFSEYLGAIGRGVCQEILYALDHRKKVYLLWGASLTRVRRRDLRVIPFGDWAVRYAEVRA